MKQLFSVKVLVCRCWSFGLGFQNTAREERPSVSVLYSVWCENSNIFHINISNFQYISGFKVEGKSLDTGLDSEDKRHQLLTVKLIYSRVSPLSLHSLLTPEGMAWSCKTGGSVG